TETEFPDFDLIFIPGGFSYGDYLRCGAIAARMPVMQAIIDKAAKGVKVLGVDDFELDLTADEFQRGIAHQRAGQEAGLDEDLEAV
ncbi:hypothetical protein ACC739_37250, partial [Rhizobium ruizarguesonis]